MVLDQVTLKDSFESRRLYSTCSNFTDSVLRLNSTGCDAIGANLVQGTDSLAKSPRQSAGIVITTSECNKRKHHEMSASTRNGPDDLGQLILATKRACLGRQSVFDLEHSPTAESATTHHSAHATIPMIAQSVAKPLRHTFQEFAAVEGSEIYGASRDRTAVYLRYVLQKADRDRQLVNDRPSATNDPA
jgi:hypothetical protein